MLQKSPPRGLNKTTYAAAGREASDGDIHACMEMRDLDGWMDDDEDDEDEGRKKGKVGMGGVGGVKGACLLPPLFFFLPLFFFSFLAQFVSVVATKTRKQPNRRRRRQQLTEAPLGRRERKGEGDIGPSSAVQISFSSRFSSLEVEKKEGGDQTYVGWGEGRGKEEKSRKTNPVGKSRG